MQRYWSQVAMLLLGITLTVGFYEGRRLVKNTAKALTAATSISSSSGGRRARDRDRDEDEDEGSYGLASSSDPDHERKRRRSRSASSDGDRAEKLTQLRARQRTRLTERREMVTPSALRQSHPELQQALEAPPPVDTAVEDEER